MGQLNIAGAIALSSIREEAAVIFFIGLTDFLKWLMANSPKPKLTVCISLLKLTLAAY